MRLHHRSGLALMASLVVGAASATTASASYVTSFEPTTYAPGALNGQDGWSGSGRVQTESQLADELVAAGLNAGQTVQSGDQAIIATGRTTNVRAVSGLAEEPVVVMDFWGRPLTPGAAGSTVGVNQGNVFITMEDSGGTRAAAVRFGVILENDVIVGNSIDIYTSARPDNAGAGWLSTSVSWEADSWYNLRMEADYVNKVYDLYIDGVQIDTFAFYDTDSADLSQIRIFTGTDQAGAIIDDMSVTAIPEPATVGLMGAAAGMALVRRRQRV